MLCCRAGGRSWEAPQQHGNLLVPDEWQNAFAALNSTISVEPAARPFLLEDNSTWLVMLQVGGGARPPPVQFEGLNYNRPSPLSFNGAGRSTDGASDFDSVRLLVSTGSTHSRAASLAHVHRRQDVVYGAAGFEPSVSRGAIRTATVQWDHAPRGQLCQPGGELGERSVRHTDEGRQRVGIHPQRRCTDRMDDTVIGQYGKLVAVRACFPTVLLSAIHSVLWVVSLLTMTISL